jgi:preprotein translocase subunit SecD
MATTKTERVSDQGVSLSSSNNNSSNEEKSQSSRGRSGGSGGGGGRAPPSRWASGRVLTEAQRIRKREVDRISQRENRRKDKVRIAELEAKLQQMNEMATSQTNNILMNKIRELELANTKYKQQIDSFMASSSASSKPRNGKKSPRVP